MTAAFLIVWTWVAIVFTIIQARGVQTIDQFSRLHSGYRVGIGTLIPGDHNRGWIDIAFSGQDDEEKEEQGCDE